MNSWRNKMFSLNDYDSMGRKCNLVSDAFISRMVCAEQGADLDIKLAFSSMGDKYFPPHVTPNSAANSIEFSCGGTNQQVDVFDSMYPNKLWYISNINAGNNGEGTWKQYRMDGESTGVDQNEIPANRLDQSGSSSTCCPPSKTFQAGCFGQHGQVSQCQSRMNLKIWVCNDCQSCQDSSGKVELVRVDTNHGLVTANRPGCKPWFSMVDAGARVLVAKLRKRAMDDKIAACSRI